MARSRTKAGLALLGILMLSGGAAAGPATDSRLMFDPGALDRNLASDASEPAAKPAKEGRIWIPPPPVLPNVEDTTLAARSGPATGLPGIKAQGSQAGTDLLEPRVSLGTLSIGLETERTIKPRSLAGDAEKDPDRNALLDDPKRQRGFLPFIGLSAKSKIE